MVYWHSVITHSLMRGMKQLVVAHGNTIRAAVMHLDNIGEDVITGVNIPTGTPLIYYLDKRLRPIKTKISEHPLSGFYLTEDEDLRSRMNEIASQTENQSNPKKGTHEFQTKPL